MPLGAQSSRGRSLQAWGAVLRAKALPGKGCGERRQGRVTAAAFPASLQRGRQCPVPADAAGTAPPSDSPKSSSAAASTTRSPCRQRTRTLRSPPAAQLRWGFFLPKDFSGGKRGF